MADTFVTIPTYTIKNNVAYPITIIVYNIANFLEGVLYMRERINVTPSGWLGFSRPRNAFYDCYDANNTLLFTTDNDGYNTLQNGGGGLGTPQELTQ